MVNAQSDNSTFRASRASQHGGIGCSRNYRPPHPSAPVSQGEIRARWSAAAPIVASIVRAINLGAKLLRIDAAASRRRARRLCRFPDESKSVAHQYDNELLIRQTHRCSIIPSNRRVASVVAKGKPGTIPAPGNATYYCNATNNTSGLCGKYTHSKCRDSMNIGMGTPNTKKVYWRGHKTARNLEHL